MADLSGKTFDELRVDFISLGEQLSVLAESRREYAIEIERRVSKAGAQAKIALLTNDEKSALKAALGMTLNSKP